MNQHLTGGEMLLLYNRIISKYIFALEWKMTFLLSCFVEVNVKWQQFYFSKK